MNRRDFIKLQVLRVAVALLVSALVTFLVSSNPSRSPTKPNSAKQLKVTINEYYRVHGDHPDTWWLESTSTKNHAELSALLEQKKVQVEQLLKKYHSANPLSERVAQRFPAFFVSLMTSQGDSVTVSKDGGIPTGVEICFVPKLVYDSQKMPSSLFWDPNWRAMKIAGIEWPEKFLPAILYHELGHGLWQLTKEASATAAPSSDLYKAEEVQMHRLEMVILDQACGGSYVKAIDKIVRRHKAKTWQSLVAKLTAEDLIELDRVSGTERCGTIATQVVLAQHLLSLGFRTIDIGDPAQSEVALYTFLTTSFGS